MDRLTLTKPDDWHVHLRDGAMLGLAVAHTARVFARAIVMPNLVPPVTTTVAAGAYRQRILDRVPAGLEFEPLMTLYLTDDTDPAEIGVAKASGFVHGVKLYPAGATTNSASGVTDLARCCRVLERKEAEAMPYRFQPGKMYRMPTHFGPSSGPRQGPDGRKFDCRDTPKSVTRAPSMQSASPNPCSTSSRRS